MNEYPKAHLCAVHGTNHSWCDGGCQCEGQVVPLSALVIERDDNGEWPEWVYQSVGKRAVSGSDFNVADYRWWTRWVLDALEKEADTP